MSKDKAPKRFEFTIPTVGATPFDDLPGLPSLAEIKARIAAKRQRGRKRTKGMPTDGGLPPAYYRVTPVSEVPARFTGLVQAHAEEAKTEAGLIPVYLRPKVKPEPESVVSVELRRVDDPGLAGFLWAIAVGMIYVDVMALCWRLGLL